MLALRVLIFVLILMVGLIIAGRLGVFRGSRPPGLGVQNGQLAPADTRKPNNVSSQHPERGYHQIAPLQAGDNQALAIQNVATALTGMPGVSIITQTPTYLHAEATSRWLRFVDDLEFALDPSTGLVHVRSAARLGRKDFGVNRARIEALRARLTAYLNLNDKQ